ncbi:metal-dependent transcriptional regulator [Fulvivirga maritima]|uniref:metal-dependent transcriptional regulator n=1 Tax=Fulvivirga maritima TaxID=2904247 RepID=UPI001F2538E0|nr:metal-dependent transcriptional regulator [Fulvivirga maritima]UII26311.1 metal-dependent transcriptional regulator [Fulvivirga maritima]
MELVLSFTEENYLKEIYHLFKESGTPVSTNAIAEVMNTKAASVTDMIKKLSAKEVVSYQRYRGVKISEKGQKAALQVIRKHRLWEAFLVDKLKFNWDEVHDVAEQLEHIKSPLLIKRLDEFLGYPKYDPHGDPIPDENGEFKAKPQMPLSAVKNGAEGIVVSVKDASASFLQYVDKMGIYIGAKMRVVEKIEFDGSLEILIDNKRTVFISKEVSENIWITE